ncbi:hypothetical protein TSUD_285040 [Trifolium subterraneum]|nr:hypothetical protein TSUD_285040 [Trifolium subterraneum]
MRAVAKRPVTIVVCIGPKFRRYTGGIFRCGLRKIEYHALLVVGYGKSDEGEYWICKNFWGDTWGVNGYVYLQRNGGTITGVVVFLVLRCTLLSGIDMIARRLFKRNS